MTGLRAAFALQSRACAALGSPFMERLMALCGERLPENGPIGARLFGWPGDVGPHGASLPLRLAGALHALVLAGDGPLAAAYPPHAVDDETLWAAVTDALARHEADIQHWLDSAPQTNEVRRSAALIAVGNWLAARFGLPLRLSEPGASGGLNLMFDRYALNTGDTRLGPDDAALTLTPDWRGTPPPRAAIAVTGRRGADLNPLNPARAEDRLRLLAYLWPDQTDRRALTEAAIATAQAPVDRADAADWLAGRLDHRRGEAHLVYHTVAWQYFPAEVQARCAALLAEAGATATPDTPLAHFGMEGDGDPKGAALTLTLWPGAETFAMGRADFHGRWIDWRAPAP